MAKKQKPISTKELVRRARASAMGDVDLAIMQLGYARRSLRRGLYLVAETQVKMARKTLDSVELACRLSTIKG